MLTNLPIEKILKTALKNGGDFAELFAESSVKTQISADNNRIEKAVSGNDRGLGLRVVYNGQTAYAFTNDSDPSSITDLAGAVAEAVRGNKWNNEINLTKKEPRLIHPIKMRPDTISTEKKADLVAEANKVAWGYDKKIVQATITYFDNIRSISIANSNGDLVNDEKIDIAFVAVIVASDGKRIETGYEPIGGFGGFEFFDDNSPILAIKTSCRRALTMLTARPAPAGKMPVVLSSEAGGTMIHEAVGHGLEADLAINGFSVYKDQIGEKVASPLVTVTDDATIPGKRGSFSFDDEGTLAQKNVLIEKGRLKSYLYDRITSMKAGTESTGNGRRESYRFRPVVRMSNTMIEPGVDDPDSILKNTDNGIFVKKMGGGQVNTINGDFVFEIQEGYLIDHGRIGEPIRGATLTGNGPQVLKIIDRVGSDLGYSIGTCGKEGQAVPVANAQPTIRIPELIVGGTS